MSAILDANGNPFHTGLLQPEGNPDNFVSARPRLQDAISLLSDSDIKDILNNPNRMPASEEFDDHWVLEGDQRQKLSCAGWGGSNALSKTRWRNGIRDGIVFSGSYPYSWCNRNSDNGSALEDIMNELMNKGTVAASKCTWSMIFRNSTQQFDTEAKQHEGLALFSIKTQAEMNTALARDQIVVVCVQVDSTKFVNYHGSGLVPAFNGPGDHCIHADDIRLVNGVYQYRVVNNWGLNWGLKGTGWTTFSSFAQPIRNHSFYVLTSINDLAA